MFSPLKKGSKIKNSPPSAANFFFDLKSLSSILKVDLKSSCFQKYFPRSKKKWRLSLFLGVSPSKVPQPKIQNFIFCRKKILSFIFCLVTPSREKIVVGSFIKNFFLIFFLGNFFFPTFFFFFLLSLFLGGQPQ